MTNRQLLISYDTPDAGEIWYIEISDPDAPEEITVEWLEDNPENWGYVDLKDHYSGRMTNLVIEEEL